MANLIGAFNNHFMEMLDDIQAVFPEDIDILAGKNALLAIRKANPKMIVKIWKTYIADKYRAPIVAGDIHFFIDKDYSAEVSLSQPSGGSDKIMESIDRLRGPVKQMGPENQAKVMKYIQNLTKMSDLC